MIDPHRMVMDVVLEVEEHPLTGSITKSIVLRDVVCNREFFKDGNEFMKERLFKVRFVEVKDK
jgi:hypothetical protein